MELVMLKRYCMENQLFCIALNHDSKGYNYEHIWPKLPVTRQVNAPAVSIDGHEDVPPNNEGALLKAAANQPIAVAKDAGGPDFKIYSEGVYTGDCGTDLDHGVAMVGYGATVDGTK